ncbi:MAG: hypothetical protein AABW54_01375, partial [Candidatus Micrarchaeota archaeon]
GCANITLAGSYLLSANTSSTGTCFTISTSNVTLDCSGRWINYSQTQNSSYGVHANSAYNATIRNCVITSTGSNKASVYGVNLDASNNATVTGNTIYQYHAGSSTWNTADVYIYASSNASVSNNTLVYASLVGAPYCASGRGTCSAVYVAHSTSQNADVYNNTIISDLEFGTTVSSIGTGARIYNNTISGLRTGDVNVFILGASLQKIFGNTISHSGAIYGGVLMLQGSPAAEVYNNTITPAATTDITVQINGGSSNSNIYSNTINGLFHKHGGGDSTNVTIRDNDLYGITFNEGASSNYTISGNTIRAPVRFNAAAAGTNATFFSNNLNASNQPIISTGQITASFENDSISCYSVGCVAFSLSSNSFVTLTNVSFNRSNLNISAANVTLQWYAKAKVTNTSQNASGVLFNVTNSTSATPMLSGIATTNGIDLAGGIVNFSTRAKNYSFNAAGLVGWWDLG